MLYLVKYLTLFLALTLFGSVLTLVVLFCLPADIVEALPQIIKNNPVGYSVAASAVMAGVNLLILAADRG